MRTEIARELIGLAGRTVWGTGPEELSMLHVLFYVAAAGSFDKLIDTEGGAQQDRLDGGAQLLPLGLAESLGDRVRLGAPVRRIAQDDGGVRIAADGVEVEAGAGDRRRAAGDRGPDRARPAAAGAARSSPSGCAPAR